MNKVGIIGAGKVGVSMAKYLFSNKEFQTIGFYSKTFDSAKYAAELTATKAFKDLKSLVEESDILIISTPDGQIEKVWSNLVNINITNKIVCHCSGSLSSKIFFDSNTRKVSVASMHPMHAFSSKEDSYKTLPGVFFTIEGDALALETIGTMLRLKSNPFKIIAADDKYKYHLANVFVSNLVVGLANVGIKLIADCGFSKEEALFALASLAKNNLASIFEKGPVKALTGPVERNDLATVKHHLQAINSKDYDLERQIYKSLSKELVKIAQEKNPSRDYGKMLENL